MFAGYAGNPAPELLDRLRSRFSREGGGALKALESEAATGRRSGVFWAGPGVEAEGDEKGYTLHADARGVPAGRASVRWEAATGLLRLKRDRMGAVSVYHRAIDGTDCFSDSLDALLRLPGPRPSFSAGALAHYLSFLHPPPGSPMFLGVGKVLPGQEVSVSADGLRQTRADWEPALEGDPGGTEDAARTIRTLLENSVRDIAGTPDRLGLLFSGGTDSTALLQLLRGGGREDVVTFTAAAEGNPDLEFARAFARSAGVENIQIVLRPEALEQAWDEVAASMEEPLGNASALATLQVANRAAGRGVGVLVSGIGSDEIFAGHVKHVAARWAAVIGQWPFAVRLACGAFPGTRQSSSLRRFLGDLRAGVPPLSAYRTFYRHVERAQAVRLLSPPAREALAERGAGACDGGAAPPTGPFPQALIRVDLKDWLLADLLPTFHAITRPHGLAGAFPFCDRSLVDFAARLPFHWKVRGLEGKRIFKRSLRSLLPPAVARRRRQGFVQPLGRWFRTDWKREAGRRLLGDAAGGGLLDPDAVRAIWEEHQSGRRDHADLIWGLLVLLRWRERYPDVQAGGA